MDVKYLHSYNKDQTLKNKNPTNEQNPQTLKCPSSSFGRLLNLVGLGFLIHKVEIEGLRGVRFQFCH